MQTLAKPSFEALSDHFGHCDAFTLVTLQDENVQDVQILHVES